MGKMNTGELNKMEISEEWADVGERLGRKGYKGEGEGRVGGRGR